FGAGLPAKGRSGISRRVPEGVSRSKIRRKTKRSPKSTGRPIHRSGRASARSRARGRCPGLVRAGGSVRSESMGPPCLSGRDAGFFWRLGRRLSASGEDGVNRFQFRSGQLVDGRVLVSVQG